MAIRENPEDEMTKTINSLTLDNEVLVQRAYYERTAERYDSSHLNVNKKDEHYFALRFLEVAIDYYGIKSILDIGAGTGRVARYFKGRSPNLKIASIEPVNELREIGYATGLTREELIQGDVYDIKFKEGQFDLVCEFGVLHHVKDPALAVKEMLRVSKIGIFISDTNNFGQGSVLARSIKQSLNALKLWGVADFIKTKGKGYSISEGDGLFYSYSVFNNFKQIRNQCHIHILNTESAGINPYRTAPHVALLGVKK